MSSASRRAYVVTLSILSEVFAFTAIGLTLWGSLLAVLTVAYWKRRSATTPAVA
ncbi:hypothetical protein [Streptomyces sp. NPDC006335]|uniref:hypothetical protein n=1 Tax=Streptomyces sp. NPDC006335 TaxID=3156895 RepID=UPI0033AA7556